MLFRKTDTKGGEMMLKYEKPSFECYSEEEIREAIRVSATYCGTCFGGYCSSTK